MGRTLDLSLAMRLGLRYMFVLHIVLTIYWVDYVIKTVMCM